MDPEQRLKQHNAGKGSVYVRSKGSVSLIYTEVYPNESAARRREVEVKAWSRQKKLALIAQAQHEAKAHSNRLNDDPACALR